MIQFCISAVGCFSSENPMICSLLRITTGVYEGQAYLIIYVEIGRFKYSIYACVQALLVICIPFEAAYFLRLQNIELRSRSLKGMRSGQSFICLYQCKSGHFLHESIHTFAFYLNPMKALTCWRLAAASQTYKRADVLACWNCLSLPVRLSLVALLSSWRRQHPTGYLFASPLTTLDLCVVPIAYCACCYAKGKVAKLRLEPEGNPLVRVIWLAISSVTNTTLDKKKVYTLTLLQSSLYRRPI